MPQPPPPAPAPALPLPTHTTMCSHKHRWLRPLTLAVSALHYSWRHAVGAMTADSMALGPLTHPPPARCCPTTTCTCTCARATWQRFTGAPTVATPPVAHTDHGMPRATLLVPRAGSATDRPIVADRAGTACGSSACRCVVGRCVTDTPYAPPALRMSVANRMWACECVLVVPALMTPMWTTGQGGYSRKAPTSGPTTNTGGLSLMCVCHRVLARRKHTGAELTIWQLNHATLLCCDRACP